MIRALVLMLVAGAAAAQSNDLPPPIAAPRPIVIEAPQVATLDNGLRVIVARRSALPLVTLELVVRSGSETDPRDLSGLADMTATLLTKGTAKRSAPQIATAAEALGGSLDSGAGWYQSTVSMTVTKPKVSAALALVAEVMLAPRFASEELERARKLALDGLSVALREPGALAGMAVDRAAFGNGTFGHPAHGTLASLAKIRRGDVVAQHGRYYRPDNASLVFVGDIDMETARELAQSTFGRWKRPATPLPSVAVDDGKRFAAPPIVIAMNGAGQAAVAMAAASIARSAPDYYAGVIANKVLGGGSTSRLYVELRVKRGLTYDIGSSISARRTAGVWRIGAQTKSESAPELVEATLAEVRRVSESAPGSEELEAGKLAMIGGTSRTFETTETLASLVSVYEANAVPLSEIPKIVDALNAVTAAQVQEFAKKHFAPEALAIVIAGDSAKFLEALRKAYPEVRVIGQDEVDLEQATLTKKN